jgi:hypothetical protein
MKKIITLISLLAFLLPFINEADAQLFRSYNKEDVDVWYYQLPTDNIYARKAQFKLIESQEKAREMLDKAGKFLGDKLGDRGGNLVSSAAAVGKSLLKDETQEAFTINLFPDVFYHTDDDIGVNVYYSRDFSPMATKSGDKWVYTWEVEVKIDAYYKDELVWSQDWTQIDGREKAGTFDPGQNQQSYTDYLKWKAYYYAKTKIYNRYGLRREHTALPVFYTKALDKEYKDIMKSFEETVEKFTAKGLTEDVKSELKMYIPKWEEVVKDYVPGTSRKEARQDARENDEAKLHDKNIWAVYYNLGLAYTLLQNEEKANENINMAIELRRIKPKVKKDEDGNVKASFTAGNTYGVVQMYLQDLEKFGPDYIAGFKAQDPMFAHMFKTQHNLRQVSSLTGSYMFSDFYSKKFKLGVFYNFFPIDMKGSPKKVDGVITKNNEEIAHYKYRDWFIIGKRTKIYNGDKTLKSVAIQGKPGSMKTGRTMFPSYTKKEWGFVTETWFEWTLKWFHSPSSYGRYTANYDWNGDILLDGKFWEDNWLAMFKSDVPDRLSATSELRIKYNEDFAITNIEGGEGVSKVTFNWGSGRYNGVRKEGDYKKEYKEFNDKGDAAKIIENGKEYEVKYSYDEKGNWIEMVYGDYIIRRKIAY